MNYPKFLQSNNKIGFIAPSFGCNTEPYKTRFQSALSTFKQLGYDIVCGPNCYAGDGIGKSSTPKHCGTEINQFFINNFCDIILSCGGGETMCEDLNFVDFEGIKKATPKWYMGYSDNTNLTFILPTVCDIAAIYGPNSPGFGAKHWHQSLHDAFELLQGKKFEFGNYDGWESESLSDESAPLEPYNINEPYTQTLIPAKKEFHYEELLNNTNSTKDRTNEVALQSNAFTSDTVTFSGRLIGGCLDCLVTLAGTQFDKVAEFNEKYADDGIIWFLESCDLNPFAIRRALWQLKNAGWFKNVKGFLIGRSLHYQDDFGGFTCLDAYKTGLEEINVPKILDIDLGHLPPAMPFISGAIGTVTATEKNLNIKYSLN